MKTSNMGDTTGLLRVQYGHQKRCYIAATSRYTYVCIQPEIKAVFSDSWPMLFHLTIDGLTQSRELPTQLSVKPNQGLETRGVILGACHNVALGTLRG